MADSSDPKRARILALIFLSAGALVLGLGVGRAIIDRTVWVPLLWPGVAMFTAGLAMFVNRRQGARAILLGIAIAAIILALVTSFKQGRRLRSQQSPPASQSGR